ncbi:MAG: ABC transporter ATP-binding protein [Bradyrhizobium sp.]|uniref:ATP-binding cassette domain-containing protein n=1 Tax=Bradyrhizobium sp. TaxID=376 RepID=UPI001DE75E62|nr:ATP-binding cassette domain-containing protein [Bradyrhizobium sp.]MBV9559140.1 ABC transporter ATP-binding protein [Bradyrhizobium sp.]
MTGALLDVANVSKTFETGRRLWLRQSFKAVDRISLEVRPGETLGIVGESGSGKSTLLRMMLRLIRPTAGIIRFDGRDIWTLSGGEILALRRQIQAVFQDPASSFNPRHSIGSLLSAPLEVHGIGTRESRRKMVADTLALVGLNTSLLARHPHQLSGGQRQRVAIARAIILRPSVVLADEPTSALDVSVQAQILNVFKKTKRELGLTYVFVSHNLAVIRYVSDRVAVMRRGAVVEMGESDAIFARPQHPYTRALPDAVPDPDLGRRGRTTQASGAAPTSELHQGERRCLK